MNLDTGLAVVILAILIFYLRLIALQRERARRTAAQLAARGKKGKGKGRAPQSTPRYSILSQNRRDWVIAGTGMLAIVLGMLLNAGVLLPAVQSYWWVPTALGIIAFSWAFQLQKRHEQP